MVVASGRIRELGTGTASGPLQLKVPHDLPSSVPMGPLSLHYRRYWRITVLLLF